MRRPAAARAGWPGAAALYSGMKRGRRSLAAGIGGAMGVALAGCNVSNMAAPGSKPTSVRTQDPNQQDGLLDMFAPPNPQTAAAWATDPYDPDLRYKGTLLLGTASWGGEPLYLGLYETHARDPEANVRVAAMRALGNHGGPEHAAILIEGLGDAEPRVRIEAARSLQRIYAPDTAVDPLIRALREATEEDAEVRAEAATALGQYAANRVVQELVAALSDPSLSVNHASLASLRVLTGQDFGYDRRKWQAWVDAQGERVFEARGTYLYPVFNRPRKILEYLPFIPPPPNEQTALPAGTPVGG